MWIYALSGFVVVKTYRWWMLDRKVNKTIREIRACETPQTREAIRATEERKSIPEDTKRASETALQALEEYNPRPMIDEAIQEFNQRGSVKSVVSRAAKQALGLLIAAVSGAAIAFWAFSIGVHLNQHFSAIYTGAALASLFILLQMFRYGVNLFRKAGDGPAVSRLREEWRRLNYPSR